MITDEQLQQIQALPPHQMSLVALRAYTPDDILDLVIDRRLPEVHHEALIQAVGWSRVIERRQERLSVRMLEVLSRMVSVLEQLTVAISVPGTRLPAPQQPAHPE